MKLLPGDIVKLAGVHKDLRKVIEYHLQYGTIPIDIIEGVRSLATQRKYVARGASKTMRSRHLTGHAIDIAPMIDGKASWAWPLYYPLAKEVKAAAKAVGVPIEWGGDWTSFKDGPHWQLPWSKYPAGMPREAAEAPPMDYSTEGTQALQKGSMVAGSGVTGASFAVGDSLSSVASVISGQQYELSSGDITRLVISGVIIAFTLVGLYLTYRSYRNAYPHGGDEGGGEYLNERGE